MLVFEDLHWIDSETQAVLDGLVESLPTARMLLLVNYRPEYQHGWGSKTYCSQIRIDPLTRESAMEILSALLGGDQALQPLKDLLIARTEGTPFYLEECVRTLVEINALVGTRGSYRLAKPIESFQFPASVQAVLAARIDRLSLRSETIASIGIGYRQRFPVCFAPCHHGSIGRRTPARTRSAAGGGVSLRDPDVSDLEYTFKHALTHEVPTMPCFAPAARTATSASRCDSSSGSPNVVEHQPQLLAHHYTEAGLGAQAVPFWQRAGERANERAAHAEAVSYLNKGLGLLEALPDTTESLTQELSLYTLLGRTLKDVRGYGYPEVEKSYARAGELCL